MDGLVHHFLINSLSTRASSSHTPTTASIQIYSSSELPLWPIYVDTGGTFPERSSWRPNPPRDQTIECGIRNGDALLFLGRRHIHYRERMPEELSLVVSSGFFMRCFCLFLQKRNRTLICPCLFVFVWKFRPQKIEFLAVALCFPEFWLLWLQNC